MKGRSMLYKPGADKARELMQVKREKGAGYFNRKEEPPTYRAVMCISVHCKASSSRAAFRAGTPTQLLAGKLCNLSAPQPYGKVEIAV